MAVMVIIMMELWYKQMAPSRVGLAFDSRMLCSLLAISKSGSACLCFFPVLKFSRRHAKYSTSLTMRFP